MSSCERPLPSVWPCLATALLLASTDLSSEELPLLRFELGGTPASGESRGCECGDEEMLKADLLGDDAELFAVVLSELAGVVGLSEPSAAVSISFIGVEIPATASSGLFLALAGVVESLTVVASEACACIPAAVAVAGEVGSRANFLELAGVVESMTVAASDSSTEPAGVIGPPGG